MGRVVLVTGVSRYLGGLLARRVAAEPDVDRVVGVDVIPPPQPLEGVEFVRADIRNPMIGRVIEQAAIDTVVHMNVIATPTFVGGRTPQKEINVIGTMQLLAACQKARSVRRLVVKSSAAVYGSTPRDPAMFTEDMGARRTPSGGFGKDSIEVEGYVRGFSRRRADVDVSVLRFANIVGPGISTVLTDYFSLPVVPTVLGFDGRLQLVHEDDAVGALVAATVRDGVGIVNVGGDGVITVNQAARLAGRPTVPVPLPTSGWLSQVVRRARLANLPPEHLQHMAFGRVLDTTRMREVLEFEPEFTTLEAFRAYVASGRGPEPSVLPTVQSALAAAERWARPAEASS